MLNENNAVEKNKIPIKFHDTAVNLKLIACLVPTFVIITACGITLSDQSLNLKRFSAIIYDFYLNNSIYFGFKATIKN